MTELSKKKYLFRMVDPVYPAFNVYSFNARMTTPLGPVCVATVINEMDGWEAEVIDENNLRKHGPRSRSRGADHKLLQELCPADIVGLYGGLTSTIPRLYEIAEFYKKMGVITVAGGCHFVDETIEEALLAGVDYIVIGEGEETIKELLKVLVNKGDLENVKGIAYKKNGVVIRTPAREPLMNFDNLPLPDFSLVRYAKIIAYPVGRIRGCGMDCEFCTVKGEPRCATTERLMEQIITVVEKTKGRKIFVVDDLFGQDRAETIRFCNMLRDYQKDSGIRLDVGVQIRLDKAKDTELLTAMRGAGISFIAIGYESPIEEELKAMKKCLRAKDMISLTKIYQKFGFLIHGMFIFGYPMKSGINFKMAAKKRVKLFREFIKKAGLDTAQVMLPIPLPGTDLRERLKKENRIYSVKDVGWKYYDGNFPIFQPDEPMTPQEMQRSSMEIMGGMFRIKSLFMVGVNVLIFPRIILSSRNIKNGWRRWYRSWRQSLIRFGGWILLKKWHTAFKNDNFLDRLKTAEAHLVGSEHKN
ncbi:MAG: B12-binding domain-containing radical SAM protein [Candidatus Omnitrophica bacterium]|nr:B12-binding domain-containing radical SAM protein [Candidatus Omnitrophota bacterium]